ncbi:MAG: transposase, partial [Methanolinea sp.]|nr:transposase [Methanolinea sp.]
YKLTLALDAHSLRPVCFLLHPGSPHDSTIFREIVSELKRRRIIRIGDTIVFDKGYYAYDNYVEGIFAFSIVPAIFAKRNFSLPKLLRKLNFPLWISGRSDTKQLVQRYTSLARRLVMYLRDEIQLVEKRSLIEDVFKMAKNAFGLKRIHKYTTRSVKKTVCLNVLLLGLVISLGLGDKIQLQRLAEW